MLNTNDKKCRKHNKVIEYSFGTWPTYIYVCSEIFYWIFVRFLNFISVKLLPVSLDLIFIYLLVSDWRFCHDDLE